jgi:cytochrome c551/c552
MHLLLLSLATIIAHTGAQTPTADDAATLYKQRCAGCHAYSVDGK